MVYPRRNSVSRTVACLYAFLFIGHIGYSQIEYLNLTGLTNSNSISSVSIGTTSETFDASMTINGSPSDPTVSSNGDIEFKLSSATSRQCINITLSTALKLYITDHTSGKPPTYNAKDSLSFSSSSFTLTDPSSKFDAYTTAIVPNSLVSAYTTWDVTFIDDTAFQVCAQRIVGSPSNNFRLPIRIGVNTSILPIELMLFRVSTQNGKVEIGWQTASETNNDYFIVERSKYGANWKEVARVNGAGDSSSPILYSALDEHPLQGTSYYRLKQVDFNGEFEYFDSKPVTHEAPQGSTLKMYRNLTENQITIQTSETELNHIQLYNAIGQNMTNQVLFSSNGTTELTLDLTALPSGMYYLTTKTSTNKLYKP